MKIIGTGSYLPGNRMTNEYLGVDDDWVYSKLGIKERRTTTLTSAFLGQAASARALFDAGLSSEEIDMIIVATATPSKLNPSTAAIIQDKLRAYSAVAFDINAVCSGFVYAMDMAQKYLNDYKNILIIGTDTFSQITDWNHRDCVFFGDGAGAVVVTQGSNLYHSKLGADGRGQHDFETRHGGTFIMDSKAVYVAGTTFLPEIINQVLEYADITIKDIDWFLPHQGSITMLKEIARCIGLPLEKMKTNMKFYGNTAGASIPILLDECKKEFQPGNRILLAAIGSGWAYGAIILEW
ncbi:hypothetical protein LCGC14_2439600 [marine sediment metagenome]|uniref:Beta-ketoacyl-[acyl-carrier-protein] synthase III C-terminal domain-containing protein n=1 Tax=marine sediment metagenome TaxID=412755 RepID=A0A0F9DWD7_9ZZZZ